MERNKARNAFKKILIYLGIFVMLFQAIPQLEVSALENDNEPEIVEVETIDEEEIVEEEQSLEEIEEETVEEIVEEVVEEQESIEETEESVEVLMNVQSLSVTVSTEQELNDAILAAADGVETEIIITSQIELTNWVIIPTNKKIILSSTLDDTATFIRESGYTNNMLVVEVGAILTTKDIILDGERDDKGSATGTLVYVLGTYYIQDGTVLRNNSLTDLASSTTYRTPYSGGGIYATGASAYIEMTGGLITNNYTTYNGGNGLSGGGIGAWNGAELKLSGGVISKNGAAGLGAGVMSTSKVTIEKDILITENLGSGVSVYGQSYQEYAELTMTGGTISYNEGSGITLYHNGYDAIRQVPAYITGGVIEWNTGSSGGGISFSIADLYVGGDVIFRNNKAVNSGGAIGCSSMNQCSSLTVTGGLFENNTAKTGGAIYTNTGRDFAPTGTIITGGKFLNNEASVNGGAIWANNEADTIIRGDGSENSPYFSGNKAENGGAIYTSGYMFSYVYNEETEEYDEVPIENPRKLIIENVTIENNHALDLDGKDPQKVGYGGAIALGNEAYVTLKNVIITGNTAENLGSAISWDPSWAGRDNRLVISEDTQIGINDSDNGVYLFTFEVPIYNEDYSEILDYDLYEMSVEVDGVLGDNARVNIEAAERRYLDREVEEVEDMAGRLVVKKMDGTSFSEEEAEKIIYQGEGFKAILNTEDESQSILTPFTTYQVFYEGNTNTEGTAPVDSNHYSAGDVVTILGPGDLGKTSLLFAGWNTAANGSGTNYKAGDEFTFVDSSLTLYAQWKTGVTVTFVDQKSGGNSTNIPDPVVVPQGNTVDKPADPKWVGRVFAHWSKTPDSDLDLHFGWTPVWSFGSDKVNANTTLYAQWRAPVDWNCQYGQTGRPLWGCLWEYDALVGDKLNASEGWDVGDIYYTTPHTGINSYFEGWYRDSTGTSAWDLQNDLLDGYTLLYAYWSNDAQFYDGEIDATNLYHEDLRVRYGTKLEEPTEPEKEGFEFKGWYRAIWTGYLKNEDGKFVNKDGDVISDSEVETSGVATYEYTDTKWDFDVDTAGPNLILYSQWEEEEAATGTLIITLTDFDDRTLPINGAVYQLLNDQNEVIREGITTNRSGRVTVLGIPVGNYKLVQVSVPSGYELDSRARNITIVANQTVMIRLSNEAIEMFRLFSLDRQEQGTLEILVKDLETGTSVGNSSFNVYDAAGELVAENIHSNEEGIISLIGLQVGTYQVINTSVPEEYKVYSVNREVEVVNNRTTTLHILLEENDGEEVIVDLPNPITKSNTIFTTLNEALDGWKDSRGIQPFALNTTIVFAKLYVDAQGRDRLLPGATFKVTHKDTDTVVGNYVTDQYGEIILQGIEYGTYIFEEISAPEGYDMPTDGSHIVEVTITVAENAHVDGYVVNTIAAPKTSFTLYKNDRNTGDELEGAEFKLLDSTKTEVEAGKVYTTDEDGKITVTGLEHGKYIFVETKAIDGYTLGTEEIEIYTYLEGSPAIGQSIVYIENSMIRANMSFIVEDAITGEKLPNASFTIVGMGRTHNITSDASGAATVNNMIPGEYVITEVTAPSNYPSLSGTLSLTVNKGGTAENETYVIQYAKTSYSVTYLGNENTGGAVPVDSGKYYADAEVTVLGKNTLEKTNYTFAGWNTQADGLGTSYAAGTTFTMGTDNVTLYAQWTENTKYTVTYDANTGTGSVTDTSSPYYEGATVTVLPHTGMSKTNWTFTGWNTQENGLGTSYAANATFSMGTSNVTLYAQWQEDTKYTVTYDANTGTGSVTDTSSPYYEGATVTVLPHTGMSKTNYTFAGWNTQENGLGTSYAANATFSMGTSNVTLYAQWTENAKYTVTYDANTGTGTVTDILGPYYEGATVTALPHTGMSKTNYTFAGWNTQANGLGTSYAANATFSMGTSNVTLYAQWTENSKYTVTYLGNTNTGGLVPTDGVEYYSGSNVTVLGKNTLEKTNYTFIGWNTQANGQGTSYVEGSTFDMGDGNVTLYAQWQEDGKYRVVYLGNENTGGTAPVDSSQYYELDEVTVSGKGTLSKTNYTFAGWNTQADGLGTSYAANTTFSMGTSNVTLYAQWTENAKYSITYETTGSTGGLAPMDSELHYVGSTVTVLGKNTLEKTNYTFIGWNTQADGLGTSYVAGSSLTMGDGPVTLYPQWRENDKFTVTYNGNRNTAGTVPTDSNQYYSGNSVTVAGQGSLVRNHHSFAGWNTQADGKGTSYTAGTTFSMGTSNVTLYAQWVEDAKYTVTYYGNESTGGLVPSDSKQYYEFDAVVVLGQGSLVKTHYTFVGWNTQADGLGTDYVAGASFAMGTVDVKLYAQWQENPKYTITYDGNGEDSGLVPVDSNQYYEGLDVSIASKGTLEKADHTFIGWNTQADGLGNSYAAGSSLLMGTANMTLYAQWQENGKYRVIYDGNGATSGTTPIDLTQYYENDVVVISNENTLLKENAIFIGWNTQPDGLGTSYGVADTFTITENVTLYAQWKSKVVTLEYFSNCGGDPTTSNVPVGVFTYNIGDTVTIHSLTPTRDNHEFMHWQVQSISRAMPGTLNCGETFVIENHVELYAQWKVVEEIENPIPTPTPNVPDAPATGVSANIIGYSITFIMSLLAFVLLILKKQKRSWM